MNHSLADFSEILFAKTLFPEASRNKPEEFSKTMDGLNSLFSYYFTDLPMIGSVRDQIPTSKQKRHDLYKFEDLTS